MMKQSKETLEPIPGYVGSYSITDGGRVYTHLKNKFLKPRNNGYGYYQVKLTDCDGKPRHHKVHKLVMLAFKGPRPSPNYEIAHLDDNPANNALSNLEYQTRSQNRRQCIANGRGNRRTVAPFLTEDNVIEMKKMYFEQDIPQTKIAKIFNCSRTHVCCICSGRRWSHVTI